MSVDDNGSPSSEEVLDMTVIDGLRELGGEDDPGLLLELIDLFLEDASERVRLLARSIDAADLKEVGRTAHALKSASANMGALGLSTLFHDLESQARSGGGQGACAELVGRATGLFEQVSTELRALRTTGA